MWDTNTTYKGRHSTISDLFLQNKLLSFHRLAVAPVFYSISAAGQILKILSALNKAAPLQLQRKLFDYTESTTFIIPLN